MFANFNKQEGETSLMDKRLKNINGYHSLVGANIPGMLPVQVLIITATMLADSFKFIL